MVYYILVGIFSSILLYHKKDCFPTLLRVVAVFFYCAFFTAAFTVNFFIQLSFRNTFFLYVVASTYIYISVQLIKYGTVNVKSLKIKGKKAKILCLSYCKF